MLFKTFATAAAVFATMAAASAAPRHGWSVFGDLKYPSDFPSFSYVNPSAPKGGQMVTIGPGALLTFDSMNAFILKGDAAQGLELVYDTLMARAFDEPDAVYGLVAETADVADDKSSVTFRIREKAAFADGSAITADDCVFSFDAIKTKGHPLRSAPLRDVVKAEAVDARTVRYTFQGSETRDLPGIVALLPVLPRKFYDAHKFDETWLEKPLGSGPYEVSDIRQGSSVTYKRRPDYWAADLNVNRGRFNFDVIRFDYYRDRAIGLQAVKAGNVDLREEFTAKDWATGYDIAAVKSGRLKLVTLPDKTPSGTQGFFINTRKAKFRDMRVRQALDLAFDYEWANKNLFFEQYKRTHSYFENSALKAAGLPTPEEAVLLAPFKAELPPTAFASAYVPPVSDGSGEDRRQIGQAARLLTDAGWVVKGGKRTNAQGEVLSIEFLLSEPSFERILGNYVKILGEKLGTDVSIRRVDEAQFQKRFKSFDFDIVTSRFGMQPTPGLELRQYFGSAAAETEGSRNLAGIKSAAVDALVERVAGAKSRGELSVAATALDRVLRAGHYWVPHWYKGSHTIAYWDKFGRPETKPDYDRGFLDTWWYDAERHAKLKTSP